MASCGNKRTDEQSLTSTNTRLARRYAAAALVPLGSEADMSVEIRCSPLLDLDIGCQSTPRIYSHVWELCVPVESLVEVGSCVLMAVLCTPLQSQLLPCRVALEEYCGRCTVFVVFHK